MRPAPAMMDILGVFSHLRVPEVGGDVVAQLPKLERDYLTDHGQIRWLRSQSHGLVYE